MSRFKTCIPIDVNAVLALLPPNHFLHGHSFNKETNSVEIEWEHDHLKTKYSFPVDFPVEDLKAKRIPGGVQVLTRGTPPEKKVEAAANTPDVEGRNETAPSEPSSSDGGEALPPAKRKRAKRAPAAGGDSAGLE